MRKRDKERLAKKYLFTDGDFTCIYFPEAGFRTGFVSEKGKDTDIRCFGGGCVDGGPCRQECPYYMEITMLSYNAGRRKGNEARE